MGRKLALTVLLFVFSVLFVIAYQYGEPVKQSIKQENIFVPVSYGSPVLWERILEEPGTIAVSSSSRALILPHHLITATELTKIYRGLSEQYQPEIIVLAGPNHFESGEANIQTCNCTYSTIEGDLKSNSKIVQKARKEKIAKLNNEAFENEHSIYAHAMFIKKFFPNTEIVPFIIRWKSTDKEVESLVSFVDDLHKSRDVLLIGSVDFSHYLPLASADFHDQSSYNAIQNFNQENIKDIEIDSPATVRLVTRWAEKNGFANTTLLAHTNSQDFFYQNKLEITTSHLYISFDRGEISKKPQISMHFFGDAMFGREIAPLMDTEEILALIAGDEDRFFMGNDFNVLNLEGVLTRHDKAQKKPVTFRFDSDKVLPLLQKYNFNAVNLANNHTFDYFLEGYEDTRSRLNESGITSFGSYDVSVQTCTVIHKNNLKIAMCGFNDVGGILPVEQSLKIITNAKKENDFVFLNVHWGEEYSSIPITRQKELARQFVDKGADMIIGHHPHVIQPLEIYKNKPIFYSLGNFIFDQDTPMKTRTGLSVGVVASIQKTIIYLLPFHTNKGEPSLLNNEETEKYLDDYTKGLEPYQTNIPGKIIIDSINEEF